MAHDDISTRMKRYEAATRYMLPPRTYTIIRCDGRAFHSFTRGMEKPFDHDLMEAMEATALYLMENMSGTLFAYQQSDEISVVLQDFKTHNTEAWMGGVVQKQASIAAAMATAAFNYHGGHEIDQLGGWALFDARTYTIPALHEVMNYLIWRQQDASRNSINMVASSVFSHKSLHGLSSDQRQEKLWKEKDINWNDYSPREKRGVGVYRETFVGPVTYTDKRTGEEVTLEDKEQSRMKIDDEIPIFTSDEGREYLQDILKVP